MKYIKQLKKVRDLLYSISEDDSRLAKEDIIFKNKHYTPFIETLKYLYNPYIKTGIQEKKLEKFDYYKETHFKDYTECLAYIAVYNTGTDEILKNVCGFINELPKNLRDFFSSLVTKSLKIGVSIKTINKACDEVIVPEFNVMLAKNIEDHKKKLFNKKILVTPKLDGIRAVYRDGVFYTRQGREISGMIQLEQEIKSLPQNFVYDGELLYTRPIPSNQRFRATTKIVKSDNPNKKDISFYVFDMINIKQWDSGESEEACHIRKARLGSLLIENKLDHIISVQVLYSGIYDEDKISLALKRAYEKDYEGVMINDYLAPYEFKRSDKLLKLKLMLSCDLKITGFEEGSGRNEGTLGALIVDYKGYALKVGSGYSDSIRSRLWYDRNSMVGKIIEVQYFEESTNKDGGLSLRFPVFLRFREDKTEPSYN